MLRPEEDTCRSRHADIPLSRELPCIAIIHNHQTAGCLKGQGQDMCFTGTQIGHQRECILGANAMDLDPIVLRKIRNVFPLVVPGTQLGDHGFRRQDVLIQILEQGELSESMEIKERGGIADDLLRHDGGPASVPPLFHRKEKHHNGPASEGN